MARTTSIDNKSIKETTNGIKELVKLNEKVVKLNKEFGKQTNVMIFLTFTMITFMII